MRNLNSNELQHVYGGTGKPDDKCKSHSNNKCKTKSKSNNKCKTKSKGKSCDC